MPDLGFGLLQPGGSFGGGGGLYAQRARDPRFAMANALIRSGTDTSPVYSPLQGIARVGEGLVGAYLTKQAMTDWDNRESNRSLAIANALRDASGTPAETKQYGDGTTINWNPVAPNMQAAISGLSRNPDTADMALSWQMAQQQAAAELENRKALAQFEAGLKPNKVSPGEVVLGPDNKPIYTAPLKPEAPKTVNTAEGVFVLNDNGTLGQRLGGPSSLVTINQPPTGYAQAPDGTLRAIPGGPADPAVIAANRAPLGPISAETAKTIGLLDSGFKGLTDLGGALFDKDGKLNRMALAMTQLPYQGGNDTAKQIATAAYLAADAELRLKTGAQAPQSEIERSARALMPNPTDSEETAHNKLKALRSYLEGVDKPLRPDKYKGQAAPESPAQGGVSAADIEAEMRRRGLLK